MAVTREPVSRCPGCGGWLYKATECVTCALQEATR